MRPLQELRGHLAAQEQSILLMLLSVLCVTDPSPSWPSATFHRRPEGFACLESLDAGMASVPFLISPGRGGSGGSAGDLWAPPRGAGRRLKRPECAEPWPFSISDSLKENSWAGSAPGSPGRQPRLLVIQGANLNSGETEIQRLEMD